MKERKWDGKNAEKNKNADLKQTNKKISQKERQD